MCAGTQQRSKLVQVTVWSKATATLYPIKCKTYLFGLWAGLSTASARRTPQEATVTHCCLPLDQAQATVIRSALKVAGTFTTLGSKEIVAPQALAGSRLSMFLDSAGRCVRAELAAGCHNPAL